MKIETWVSDADKRRWKIVRTDKYEDVPGMIVAADEESGECSMFLGGETRAMNFGPCGIRIVRR